MIELPMLFDDHEVSHYNRLSIWMKMEIVVADFMVNESSSGTSDMELRLLRRCTKPWL